MVCFKFAFLLSVKNNVHTTISHSKQEVWSVSKVICCLYRRCDALRSASSQSADTYRKNGNLRPQTMPQSLSSHLYFVRLMFCGTGVKRVLKKKIKSENMSRCSENGNYVYTLALILNDASRRPLRMLSPTPFLVSVSHCCLGESWPHRRQPAINICYRHYHANAYRSSHNKKRQTQ